MKTVHRHPPVNRRLHDDGFTLMEIMIVLAVAGLMMLIVFQAIPSLQRASRNSQRKQDVQVILQAVSRYELNDAGKFPDDCGPTLATACYKAGGSTPNDYFLRFSQRKLTIYTDPGQVRLTNLPASTAGTRSVTDVGGVAVFNHQRCIADGESTSQGAGYNDVVALYALESGNGSSTDGTQQCQQL